MAVQLPPNSTGTVVDTLTLGGVDRQVVAIGDSSVAGNRAAVDANGSQQVVQAHDVVGARTIVSLSVDRITGVTTEALVTMSIDKGGTVTTGTSYTVTTGKMLRIQSFYAEVLNTTTVVNRVLARLRWAASGSVTVASPAISAVGASAPAALAAALGANEVSYEDGKDIPGGTQIGISQLASINTAGIVSLYVVAFEY